MPRCLHWNLLLHAFKARMHGYKNAPVIIWWVNILHASYQECPLLCSQSWLAMRLVVSYPARSLNKRPGYEALQTAVFMNTVHSGNKLEWMLTFATLRGYRMALKFRGSLISQIYNRSQKYLNENFCHTAYTGNYFNEIFKNHYSQKFRPLKI